MNILFAGSPQSAAKILDSLSNESNINIKAVITQPDKRGKRGSKLIESAVANKAKSLNIKTFKPEHLDNDNLKAELSSMEVEFLIVVAYGKIIPSWLLELPSVSPINVHFSILPRYRGASPIQSAILNGDTSTGISIIKINNKLDSGDIYSVFKQNIEEDDNKISLEKKLTELCNANLFDTLDKINSNQLDSSSQDHSKATYCNKVLKQESEINFNDGSIDIINKYRAYIEWPGIYFKHKNKIIKIHKIEKTNENSSDIPGTIHKIDKTGLYINTSDQVVVITYLQFQNKNIISSNDLYNSHKEFFT
jgi:methionyl-tRNA formyltransferase